MRSPWDPRSIESAPGLAAPSSRPLLAPPSATPPRPLEPLLATEVPAALDDLWADIIDPQDGLLIALHRALGSQNFIAVAPPVPPSAAAENVDAADLVLSFTTPLPLAGLYARNTEALVARRTGRGAFSIASVCGTQGVPMAGSFINKLLWEARASSSTTTSLRISACTEFSAPVLGLVRSQIERESLKGMRESYATLAEVLQQRYPREAAAAPAVSNLRRPGAMSAPLDSSTPSPGDNPEKESETPAPQRPRRRRRLKLKKPVALPAPTAAKPPAPPAAAAAEVATTSTDSDLTDPNDSDEEDEEDLMWERRPHRTAFRFFRSKGDVASIKRAVAERWPEWVRNRYWMLTLGPHGGVRAVEGVPTPDEAIGLLWAVGAATAGARPALPGWRFTVPKDPLVRGTIEAMRLLPPRVPSRAAAGGGPAPRPPVIADGDPARTMSPAAVSSAMFVLGWLGGDSNWVEEMEALCERLPYSDFPRTLHVYNAIWALRNTRHWTCHLPGLEARTVELLDGNSGARLSTRSVRHAGFAAQGLVHLGHVPRDLFNAVTPLVCDFWDWRTACSLSWALAIANELDSPLVDALLTGVETNAADALKNGLPRRVALSKLHQLLASLERLAPSTAARVAAWEGPAATIAANARAEWEHLVTLQVKHTSAAQIEVYESLVTLGYGDAELESTAAGLSVDVAVPGVRLAVEVDGLSHFARNRGDMAVGNDLWKRRMLQAHGWRVINVNVSDWARTRGAGQRRELLRDAIEREDAAARARKRGNVKRSKGKQWWGRKGKLQRQRPAVAAAAS